MHERERAGGFRALVALKKLDYLCISGPRCMKFISEWRVESRTVALRSGKNVKG
jgi:hypothetical protein